MRQIRIASTFLFLILMILSCGDDSVVDPPEVTGDTTQVPELSYAFADYIHFDTTGYILQETKFNSNNTDYWGKTEPFLNYEKNLGEPFTDLNGNGVYDPGIDLFIRSLDSTNQDLNRDGFHNDSSDLWLPGVPFDDVNGDGEFLYDPGYFSASTHVAGLPYYDLNGNNKWDSLLDYQFGFLECSTNVAVEFFNVWYKNAKSDMFMYHSDSGLTYTLDRYYFGSEIHNANFSIYDGYKFTAHDLLEFYWYADSFYILEDTIISNDSIWFKPKYRSDSLLKVIELDSQLDYKDTTYTNLLKIRLSFYNSSYDTIDKIIEFYFEKNLGFICFFKETIGVYGTTDYYYLLNKVDSLPLLLTKP